MACPCTVGAPGETVAAEFRPMAVLEGKDGFAPGLW